MMHNIALAALGKVGWNRRARSASPLVLCCRCPSNGEKCDESWSRSPVQAGRWEEAQVLFRGMATPDQCSYETMIAAYGLSGKADEAEAIFVEMTEERGFAPRDYGFTALIAAHRQVICRNNI